MMKNIIIDIAEETDEFIESIKEKLIVKKKALKEDIIEESEEDIITNII